MVDYPVNFSSTSEAKRSEKKWTTETDDGLKTAITPPEEFGGSSNNPSPESLFTASLQSCMVATFQTIAERKNLTYQKINSNAEASLDRGEDTRPLMKTANIVLRVSGIQNKDKAKEVAAAVEKNCFIHNSVKTDVETAFEFEE